MVKKPHLRTLRSNVSVEILPKENWEEVAYVCIKGMAVQAHGLLGQMKQRRGEEKLKEAVEALENAAEEILNEDPELL